MDTKDADSEGGVCYPGWKSWLLPEGGPGNAGNGSPSVAEVLKLQNADWAESTN